MRRSSRSLKILPVGLDGETRMIPLVRSEIKPGKASISRLQLSSSFIGQPIGTPPQSRICWKCDGNPGSVRITSSPGSRSACSSVFRPLRVAGGDHHLLIRIDVDPGLVEMRFRDEPAKAPASHRGVRICRYRHPFRGPERQPHGSAPAFEREARRSPLRRRSRRRRCSCAQLHERSRSAPVFSIEARIVGISIGLSVATSITSADTPS